MELRQLAEHWELRSWVDPKLLEVWVLQELVLQPAADVAAGAAGAFLLGTEALGGACLLRLSEDLHPDLRHRSPQLCS